MAPQIGKQLPRYDALPAILLGRLAVDLRHKGRGLGAWLLIDALSRSLSQTANLGAVVVVTDALSEEAATFYERFGFVRVSLEDRRLYIPMTSIKRLLQEPGSTK